MLLVVAAAWGIHMAFDVPASAPQGPADFGTRTLAILVTVAPWQFWMLGAIAASALSVRGVVWMIALFAGVDAALYALLLWVGPVYASWIPGPEMWTALFLIALIQTASIVGGHLLSMRERAPQV
jgi:hypothetical protein